MPTEHEAAKRGAKKKVASKKAPNPARRAVPAENGATRSPKPSSGARARATEKKGARATEKKGARATGKKSAAFARAEEAIRRHALALPEAYEEFPWGERAIKVKKKVFLFMRATDEAFGLSAKLPHSRWAALELPFAEPTHYGLGKSGWVTASFAPGETPPVDLFLSWIEESYRAVAPKSLVDRLPAE